MTGPGTFWRLRGGRGRWLQVPRDAALPADGGGDAERGRALVHAGGGAGGGGAVGGIGSWPFPPARPGRYWGTPPGPRQRGRGPLWTPSLQDSQRRDV